MPSSNVKLVFELIPLYEASYPISNTLASSSTNDFLSLDFYLKYLINCSYILYKLEVEDRRFCEKQDFLKTSSFLSKGYQLF